MAPFRNNVDPKFEKIVPPTQLTDLVNSNFILVVPQCSKPDLHHQTTSITDPFPESINIECKEAVNVMTATDDNSGKHWDKRPRVDNMLESSFVPRKSMATLTSKGIYYPNPTYALAISATLSLPSNIVAP